MFLDVIRASFEAIEKLFDPETYTSISTPGFALFIMVLLAVAPIIIYGLSNLLFWFFGERKLEKSVVQCSVRRRIKQIVGMLLMLAAALVTINVLGVYFITIVSDKYVAPILSPILYCIVVLGFIAFVKYTIGNIVKLIAGAIKRKK